MSTDFNGQAAVNALIDAGDVGIGHTYIFRAYHPLVVRDRPALLDVLQAEKPDIAEQVDAAMLEGDRLHVAKWRRLRKRLNDPAVQRAERLLAGGGLKWQDKAHNLVVDEGLNDILDKYYKGSSYTASHYVRLTDGSPTFAADDTLGGTHSGWTEVTAYDESPAPTFSPGTVSGQSVDNSGSPASFSINSDSTTIGGGFLATDGTVGGTSGILVGGAAFSGDDRTLASGDSLDVTATASASSS
jgi:hypothetical protein